LTKGEDGAWLGASIPQDEGFHYYQIVVDGAQVPDPGSLYFYGAGRWGSGVEVSAQDADFYALQDVPHGQLREVRFFSKSANAIVHCFVYTPPAVGSVRQCLPASTKIRESGSPTGYLRFTPTVARAAPSVPSHCTKALHLTPKNCHFDSCRLIFGEAANRTKQVMEGFKFRIIAPQGGFEIATSGTIQ
jgi:hypothetical protein